MRSPSSPDLIRILLGWLLGPCSLMDLNERMAGISYKKDISPSGKGCILSSSEVPCPGCCGVNTRR